MYRYAVRVMSVANVLPVVMEPRMIDAISWRGPVGMQLGGVLNVPLVGTADITQGSPRFMQLCREIIIRLPTERQHDFVELFAEANSYKAALPHSPRERAQLDVLMMAAENTSMAEVEALGSKLPDGKCRVQRVCLRLPNCCCFT